MNIEDLRIEECKNPGMLEWEAQMSEVGRQRSGKDRGKRAESRDEWMVWCGM